jgi:hypothetical protein
MDISNFKITPTDSLMGLTIDSVYTNERGFHSRKDLGKMASHLLKKEKYKDHFIFFDGCMRYRIKTQNDMKKVNFKFEAYAGAFFEYDDGTFLDNDTLLNSFMEHNGRKGKVLHAGYTSVYQQGYSGGYDNYKFIYQDDLSSVVLRDEETLYLISAKNNKK